MAATTRIAWLVMGSAFGLGCASALSPFLSANLVRDLAQQASLPAMHGERTLEDIVGMAPQALDKESAPVRSRPLSAEVRVGSGDTLMDVLLQAGISKREANDIIDTVRPLYDPKRLSAGNRLRVEFSKESQNEGEPSVQSIVLPLSVTSTVEIKRSGEDFRARQIDIPTERKLAHAGGTINSSLYQTAVGGGLPPALVNELISAYSYDVDFQREIKQGNAMDVLFERVQTKDGKPVGYGNVVYAELALSDRTMKIYRYTDASGNADYYNAKGESVRKALLRTPINGAKITSGFGMRNHPLLGYTKMHRGVDFGAPTGTPIYAAGDATVEFVGVKGGYGNYIRLKHNTQYDSAYAHISRFASGIAPGKKVKQGQIIAYVGSTGASTGPHLHYEILASNQQVNPANVKFKTGNVLAGKELAAFRANMQKVEQQMASLPRRNVVAMSAQPGSILD